MINDNDQIASLEQAQGFSQSNIESHLTIIGILENLKEKHLNKLGILYRKTIKPGIKECEVDDTDNEPVPSDEEEVEEEDEVED